jgi:hypothetical protein
MVGVVATVNPLNGADTPPGVVTATVRTPRKALWLIEIVTGKYVPVPPVPMLAVTPDPLKLTAEEPARFEPEIEAGKLVPGAAAFGVMPVMTAKGGPTVNPMNGADVPPDVVTVNDLEPSVAFA